MLPMRALIVLFLCLASALASASPTPYLVSDLNPQPDPGVGSSPYFLTRSLLNGATLFVARGLELAPGVWRTDGTAEGTYLLLPLAPSPNPVTRVLNTLIDGNTMYLGIQESEGYRIWRTDGTAGGTAPVTASRSGTIYVLAVAEQGLIVLDSGLRELKLLKGEELLPLATLRTGTAQSTSYTRLGGKLYVGTESGLWKSDGTPAGTTKFSTVPASRLLVSGDRIFFDGFDAASGRELWTTDGTTSGTRIVADLRPGAESLFGMYSNMLVIGDRVLFLGARGEIGVSDGTAANSRILLTGAPAKAFPSITSVGSSTWYFQFDDGQHGRELWRSDGTVAGTHLVRDASDGDSPPTSLAGGATRVYFYGTERDRPYDYELFESDGTEAGTRVVPPRGGDWRGSGTSYQTLTTDGDTVFFSGETGREGIEPWIRDAAGVRLIANVAVEAAGSSSPSSFFPGRDFVLFSAMNRFWRSDGTPEGTQPVTAGGGTPLAAVGNDIYFSRPRASLFRSDGAGGEILVKSFDRGSVDDVSVIGGKTHVRADDGLVTRIFVTDGSHGSMVPLHDDIGIGGPGTPVDFAGVAYFLVGRKGSVYATNGTPESTRSVARTDDRFTSPWSNLIPFNGALYLFAEHQRDHESVLWKFSGTAAHAEVVKRFPGGSYIVRPTAAATPSALIFAWQASASSANQLWKTDGTTDGTVMVREFKTAAYGTTFTSFVSLGDRVIFGVDDGVHGVEPWATDGTEAGTVLLADIHPTGGSSSGAFVVADGVAYFVANDPEHGTELWQTDGTPQGTRLAADVWPGAKGAYPAQFLVWRDRMFFAATTPETGRELWALPLIDAALVVDDVRVREGAGTANVSVRLTRASNRGVTVAWRTVDGAARAGVDFTQSGGTLTFAPGETLKTAAVPIRDDAEPGAVRAFTVRLENATVPLQDAAGAVIVEDDDVRTDVALSLVATDYLPILKVTNAGPSGASNVRLCWAVLPAADYVSCAERTELAPGASFTRQISATGSSDTIAAAVTQWEPDDLPSNNAKTWLASGWASSSMYVEPATPRVGQTGTIAVAQYDVATATTVTLTSSDPTVLSVPASIVIPAQENSATTTFTALREGTATITAKTAFGTETATLRVYSASDTIRIEPIVGLTSTYNWMFGAANVLSARVEGIAAGGARPTGTVTFYEGQRLLATVGLVDGAASHVVTTPTPGSRGFTARYNGDAKFSAGGSRSLNLTVFKARPSIRVIVSDEDLNASVIVTGTAGKPPTGTASLNQQGAAKQVTGPLAASTFSSSSTRALSLSPTPRTVTVTYSGDAYYDGVTVTIPVEYGKHRSSRH